MPDALHPDEVLFESDDVRVTTRRVVVHGRTWTLEHVCGVTVLLQPLADRLLRAHAVLVGALLLGYGLVQGPLASDGGPGCVVLSVTALLGYAALSWRVLHFELTHIWLHTRFSSQLLYRGRSSTTADALAYALRQALRQRRTDDAHADAA